MFSCFESSWGVIMCIVRVSGAVRARARAVAPRAIPVSTQWTTLSNCVNLPEVAPTPLCSCVKSKYSGCSGGLKETNVECIVQERRHTSWDKHSSLILPVH